MAVVAAMSQLTPCEEQGSDRSQYRGLVDLAVSQVQEAVFHGGKSDRVSYETQVQRGRTIAGNPYALGAVLQNQSHAGLIVSDGSAHALAIAVVLNPVANQNLIHRRYC